MAFNTINYALSKKQADAVASGVSSAVVDNVAKTIKFNFTNGSSSTMTFTQPTGIKSISIDNLTTSSTYKHVIVTYSDNSTEDIGLIPEQDINISSASGNILELRADGYYVPSTGVELSKDTKNQIVEKSDGLFVGHDSEKVDVDQTVANAGKALIVGANGKVTVGDAGVKVSAKTGNDIKTITTVGEEGIYVDVPVKEIKLGGNYKMTPDTNGVVNIKLETASGKNIISASSEGLFAEIKVDPNTDNILEKKTNGLFVSSSSVKVSSKTDNDLKKETTVGKEGLYVNVPVKEVKISGNKITPDSNGAVDVKIDSVKTDNVLSYSTDGLYVPDIKISPKSDNALEKLNDSTEKGLYVAPTTISAKTDNDLQKLTTTGEEGLYVSVPVKEVQLDGNKLTPDSDGKVNIELSTETDNIITLDASKKLFAKNPYGIVDKYSSLPTGLTEAKVYFVEQNETIGTDTFTKGFYIYSVADAKFIKNADAGDLTVESTDLEVEDIFGETATVTNYKGDSDSLVSSEYLYTQLDTVATKLITKIDELYDINSDVEYYILDEYSDLTGYDLSTLTAKTFNLFLVKSDSNYPIDASATPIEYYTTMYAVVAYTDVTKRQIDYIGKLNFGEVQLVNAIKEEIKKTHYEEVVTPAHHEVCSSSEPDALEVVDDSTPSPTSTQIIESDLTKLPGATINIGDYVKFVNEVRVEKSLFVKTADVDVDTLGKLSTLVETVEGIEKEYLAFNGAKIETDLSDYYNKEETDDLFKVKTAEHYEKVDSSDTEAKVIVADGTLADADTEVEETAVNTKGILPIGETVSVGDYVKLVAESEKEKYVKESLVDVTALGKLSTTVESVDGTDKEYLLFNGDKIETDLSDYYDKEETDKLFKVEIPEHYIKVESTESDAKIIVGDGLISDPDTEVEESTVSTVGTIPSDESVAIGDYVKLVAESEKDKFVKDSLVDVSTLGKLGTLTETVDGEDKEYLSFNGTKIETDLTDYYDKDETDDLFKVTIPEHYKKVESTTEGALVIVADGTLTDADTEIEESDVAAIGVLPNTVTVSIGDYVKLIPEEIKDKYATIDYLKEELDKKSDVENIWFGTRAEFNAAVAAGEIKEGQKVCITDEEGVVGDFDEIAQKIFIYLTKYQATSSTDAEALEVVDNTEVITTGEKKIHLEDVTPVVSGYTAQIGDYVKTVSEQTNDVTFVEKKDVDLDTLKGLGTITETVEGVDKKYLSFNNSKIETALTFEDEYINFSSTAYQNLTPTTF